MYVAVAIPMPKRTASEAAATDGEDAEVRIGSQLISLDTETLDLSFKLLTSLPETPTQLAGWQPGAAHDAERGQQPADEPARVVASSPRSPPGVAGGSCSCYF